jgi:predicted CopG family antitoxin
MGTTIELDEDLYERLETHLEEGETVEEFIEELVNMYETEGAFIQEGYSE